ncbi:MAG TPA: NAD-dependent epimerase/dehydratase family protein [Pyrinomonadaceae bacterium]|nr:NAD-dependent epimerase/dehydratase family protein [Pyrinomonadaceae bacterium]
MAKSKALNKIEKFILVTGGTGFLGSEIVRQLIGSGEKRLRVLASRVPQWMTDQGIDAVEGTINDANTVRAALRNVSVIFHLAGKVSRNNEDAGVLNRIHVEGTRILLRAAKELGVQTVILSSSSGTIAVSKEEQIIDETFPPPVEIISKWAYYASKFYQERTAIHEFDGEGCKLVILNPTLLLGPGDERLSSTKVVLDFMARKIPYCPSGGLSFVDVRDTAAAFLNSVESGRHQEKYLIGAANMRFAEFFGRLERLTGVSAPKLKMPKKFAVGGAFYLESLFKNWGKASPVASQEVEQAEHFWYLDSSKAEDELSFKARDPQETLFDTVKFLRNNILGEEVFSSSMAG